MNIPNPRAMQKTVGLPDDSLHDQRLHYCETVETFVLFFNLNRGGIPFGRIYIRHRSASSYREVPVEDDVSLSSPMLSYASSDVFAVKLRWKAGGGHPEGVIRFPLNGRAPELWMTAELGGLSISELCGVSQDGTLSYAVAARNVADAYGIAVLYSVVAMDWTRHAIEPVADLPNVFF
jgi:hypothetical protein